MNEIKLPQLGQSVEEASIVDWLKKEGDAVAEGEPLFTVQTDKAEIEVESTAAGVLRKILVPPDEFVEVMTVVALVGDANEALPDLSQYGGGGASEPKPQSEPAPEPTTTSPSAGLADQPAPAQQAPAQQAPAPAAGSGSAPASPRARAAAKEAHVDPTMLAGSGVGGRVMEQDVNAYAEATKGATPTARRVAEQQGVDLRGVEGTGPRGRVTKDDVAGGGAAPAAAPQAAPAPAAASAAGEDGVRSVPLSPMRKVIADRMGQSKFTAPHYYVTVEVDMSGAVALRGAAKQFKPSFNDIVIAGTVKALQEFPAVNARWAGDAIEEVADINIGVAVALPAGLIVPVIKRAQTLSMQGINENAKALAEKARNNRLTPSDYTGNTFTISNLGAFGVDQFTAIINLPDSAILAVSRIKDKPVVVDGGIHIRPMMNLTLSSDHRVIDGALAAQFMGRLREILEEANLT